MEIVQKAWRTGAQAARLLQLEEGVEQLPVLAEVVYKPVQGQCRETTPAQCFASERVREAVKLLGHDRLFLTKQPGRRRVGHKRTDGGRGAGAHAGRRYDQLARNGHNGRQVQSRKGKVVTRTM
jgi:hypothetical protein